MYVRHNCSWIFLRIEKKVRLAKPEAKLTTPSTAAIKALKKIKDKKYFWFLHPIAKN